MSRTKTFLGLFAGLLLAGQGVLACQSILGIESDRASVSPPYDGCSKGVCSGCLSSEDKDECEGNGSGHSGSGNGGAGGHSGSNGASGHSNTSGNGTGGNGNDHGGTGTDDGGRTNGGGTTSQPDGGLQCDHTDCYAGCICEGGSDEECTADCQAVSGAACTESDSCSACQSDWGSCACNNYAALENCFFDPSIGLCPGAGVSGECSSCTTNGTACLCELGSESECYDEFFGSGAWASDCASDGCNSCSCESCPTELYLCAGDAGCIAVVSCMATNGCTDIGCPACTNTVSSYGGIASTSAGLAEALEACRGDSGCTACFP